MASHVHSLDVVINKPFKYHVSTASKKLLKKHLVLYTESELTALYRRILTSKWVSKALAIIKVDKEMIRRSFVECGLSSNLDGSKNHLVNIKGLQRYRMSKLEQELHLARSEAQSQSQSGYKEGNERSQPNV